VVKNLKEGEIGNREEYSSQSWIENTDMTDVCKKLAISSLIKSLCAELEKMPLITFWSKI
jgi:hypothetical protein